MSAGKDGAAPRAPQSPAQNCFLVAFVLFLVATSVTVIQYKVPTIMVPLMEQFSLDSYTASWLMSVFTFVGMVCSLPAGMACRSIGPKKLVLFAVALAVASSVCGAFATHVGVLLATRALEGVSLVCVIACGPVIIQTCVAPERVGTASGIWMLGGMLGATIAGVLTPALYGSFGFRGLWLGYAAFAGVAGLIFAFAIRVPKNPSPSADPKPGRIDRTAFLKANTLRFFMPHAVFQVLLLSVLTYAPTFLQQQGAEASVSGLISTLPTLLAVVSSIAFGAVSDATHRCKPLCVAGLLAMALCTPVMLTCTGAPLWAAVAAMGLVAMGTPTVVIAAYPKVLGDPALLTVGMGVLMLVQSIGQFLGSFVPALLLGPDLSQWVLCATVLCGIGLVGTVSMALCRFK